MDSIVIHSLRKSYGRNLPPAVDLQTDVTVAKGELFGIIGPDGAGKTTLFRMLATLVSPDAGSATLEGLDIVRDYRKVRTIIGYMPGRFSLYSDLSVRENLEFFASVFGKDIESNYGLIENIYCRLKPFEDRKAGKLSGGMKQKLALCCSLIHSPAVLFLDEPTTGVDPSSRRELWENLAQLKEQGMTIVVSTAYMDEAVSVETRTSHKRLIPVCHVDYDRQVPLIVLEGEKVVALARVAKVPLTERATLQLEVADAYQKKGLGKQLVAKCVEAAQKEGVKELVMKYFEENEAMKKLAVAFEFEVAVKDGVVSASKKL